MSLFDKLRKIADAINQQRHLIRNEDETTQVSVYPFFQALGYNPFSLIDVKSQYTADPRPSGGERVDYAIMREGKPVILIEAKSANSSLSENYWRQLHDYFNAEEVRFGILTNGLEYRFYTDHKKRNIMDNEPFLVIDLLQLNERTVTELEPFRKSQFSLDRALFSAQKQIASRYIEQEFQQPSVELVKYFAQSIFTGESIESNFQHYSSVVKEALRVSIAKTFHENSAITKSEPAPTEINVPKLDKNVKPEISAKQEITQARSSERRIIEIPVFGKFLEVEYQATLLFNPLSRENDTYSMSLTKIRWENDVVSVNEAEYRAIRTINPDIKQPKWKGWNTWKLSDPNTGKLRAIRDLLTYSEFRDQILRD